MKRMRLCLSIVSWGMVGLVYAAHVNAAAGGGSSPSPAPNPPDGQAYPQILWWHDLGAPSFGSGAAADLDRDGRLEVVFGTYFNDESIHALNGEDGSTLWSFDTGGCNDASAAIADVDLDGELEVIAPASSPSTVYCFDGATGGVEWTAYTGLYNCIDSPPAVADVDHDGRPEVVVGTFLGHVFCLNGENGGIRWHINLGTNSYIQSDPAIVDVDQNGQLDVVVAQWGGAQRVYALRGDTGATIWYSDDPQDDMYHGGSFADVDEDGKPEIAVGCYDGKVRLLNGETGGLAWQYTAPYYVGAPTSIGDLNGDGHEEIVFAAYNRVGALSRTGGSLWNYTAGGGSFRGAALADVDGDAGLEVIFGADNGVLYALRGHNGQALWTYNLQAHYGRTFQIDHAPVIADFNGDGRLDIFVVGGYGTSTEPESNHGRAYALAAGEGRGSGWPMFRHDLRHSGTYTVAPEPIPAISSWGILVMLLLVAACGSTILQRHMRLDRTRWQNVGSKYAARPRGNE